MIKKIWLILLFANSIVCSPFDFYIGGLIGSVIQGLIYQAAKQGVNQRFVEYIKEGSNLFVTSFAMKAFNGQSDWL